MNAVTIGNVVESYAWCTVQVTFFAAAATLVYGLVRRQSSDRNVLLLAVSLIVVALLTTACLSPWPRWEVVGEWQWTETSSSEAINVVNATPSEAALPLGGTPGASSNGRGRPQSLTPRPSPSLRDVPPPTIAMLPLVEPLLAEINRPFWRLAVGAAWLLATIGIARFLVGLAFVHRYRRQSVPIDDAQLLNEFDSLARELQVTSPVKLVEVPSLGVAATIGWRRPLVLLPSTWRDWSADERRAVLAHELAHVAQRHFPLWLVGQLAVAAHFYHPLVHWLGRRLRLEQEIAADDLAADVFGNRRHYANVLAGLALGPTRRASAHASLGLFMSRPLLMRRIAVLHQSTNEVRHASRFAGSMGLALLLSIALIAFGLRATPNVAAADERATESAASASSPTPTVSAADAPQAEPAPVYSMPTMKAPISPPQQPAAAPFAGERSPAGSLLPSPPPPQAAAIANSDVREVTALIQISSESRRMLGQNSDEQSWKVFSRTQAALLNSKFFLQSALQKPDIAKLPLVAAQQEPVNWLHRHLRVAFIPDTEILAVSMVSKPDDTDQMRSIVDAVVHTYMDKIVAADEQRRTVVRDALTRSYSNLSKEIRNKWESQNLLAEKLGILGARERDPEAELLMRELAEAVKSRAELERKLAEVQTQFMVIEQQLKDPSAMDELVDDQLADDPNMNMMNQELMELQYRLNAQTGEMKRGRSNETERLQQQISAKQKQIAQYKTQLKLQLQTADNGDVKRDSKRYPIPELRIPDGGPNPLRSIRKEFQIRAGVLQQQIAALNDTIQEKTEKLSAKNQKSVELKIGAAELEQLQQIAAEMSLKLEMFDIEAVAPPRVRVIQWAM